MLQGRGAALRVMFAPPIKRICIKRLLPKIRNLSIIQCVLHGAFSIYCTIYTMWDRENGAHWKEANSTLAQIMQDYLGTDMKSGTMMTAGLKYLRQLREMALEELQACNAHELMRVVEVLDMIDMGEASFQCVMERRETRAAHKRSDYKYTNPLLAGCMETIEKKNGEAVVNFRKIWRK